MAMSSTPSDPRVTGPVADAAGRAVVETPSHDIVNQEKLTRIVEQVWLAVPRERQAAFTAHDWRKAIFVRCAPALIRAEEKLVEDRADDKVSLAKIRMLRLTFAQQVHRAMHTVSKKYVVV